MSSVEPRPDRRVSAIVLLVGLTAFVVLAAWRVPWQWVPGGHPRTVAPDRVFTVAQIARAERYAAQVRPLAWTAYAVGLLAALVLGLTPLGRRVVGRIRGPWWWQVPAAAAIVVLIGRLLTVGFAIRIQQHERTVGLSRQPWSGWWTDLLLGLAVSWVATSIGLLALIGVARRAPRRWPAVVGGLALVLVAAGSFLYPVVVEPLFNRFTPLPPGQLRSQILRIAAIEHVRIGDVLVADASKQTTALNAYVSGFGSTRRVVLYDNLLHGVPRRQVLVVVAHELGHARHQDVVLGTALGGAGAVAGVGLLGLLVGAPGVRRRAGGVQLGEATSVPLVLALVAAGSFLAGPAENAISRAIEARADRAALDATHDVPAFVAVQRRLATAALQDPTPPAWSQFWFGTHPTALQRVGIAEALRARGELGASGRANGR